MTRSMRRLTVLTLGATMCVMTQLAPAHAALTASIPTLPAEQKHTIVVDVHTGEMLSISSGEPLSDEVVKQFESLPGAKTYTQDVYTGRVLSIARN
jgi:methionine-rich copper-binding protein CopC